MRSPVRAAASLALLLVGAPACRGCLVDELTYAGAGGAGSSSSGETTTTTATTDASSTATTASSGGDGGASSSSSTAASTGGGGAGTGGDTGSTGSVGGGGGDPDGCPTGDDFEDGLDACWTAINEGAALMVVGDGVVQLTPEPGTGWYDDEDGIFVYQEVTGDFTATLRVETVTEEDGSYQLAGFLLRDPASGDEDWIKSEVGKNQFADTSFYVGVTVASDTFIADNAQDGFGDSVLGICRRGDQVWAANQRGDLAWDLVRDLPYDPAVDARVPDLPPTIQVGFNAAATTGDGLVATIDDFRISPGGAVDDCLEALEDLWPSP